MNTRTAHFTVSTVTLSWAASAVFALVLGCGQQADAHDVSDKKPVTPATPEIAAKPKAETPTSPQDKPLSAARLELIDLAFQTASALPTQPHLKNRCRVQETVVATCFELDQPQRALGYIEKIDNWRRAASYADYAFYCAEHGNTATVQKYLDLAQKNAPIVEDDSTQDWQRDRIKATIAKTHLLLGHTNEANRFESSIVDSERGMLNDVRAQLLTPEAFDREIQTVDSIVQTNNFDQVRNILNRCALYFDHLYADKERSQKAEDKIRNSWGKLPIGVRIDLLNQLTQFALDHKDSPKALALVDETRTLADTAKWTPDDRIPFLARLAALRHRAGDKVKALADLAAAQTLFDSEHDKIVNIYRAGVLRPVAEAYQSIGDSAKALTVYKRVVEEGLANPNSRPRAEALAATCCSMAVHGVEPDAEFKARLQQVRDGLSAPW